MKDMGRNHEVKEPIKNINFFLEKKCVENTKIYLQYKMLQKQDIQCIGKITCYVSYKAINLISK